MSGNYKIDKLTPEQEAKFPEYVKKYIAMGLCTERANRPLSEDAINLMYKTAGMKNPIIYWSGSPLAMYIQYAALFVIHDDATGLEKKYDGLKYVNLVDCEKSTLYGLEFARDYLSRLIDLCVSTLPKGKRKSAASEIREKAKLKLRESLPESCWGQHDADYLAYYAFFRNECGLVEETEQLLGLFQLGENCGWMIPLNDVAIACERHSQVHLLRRGENNYVLHNETGPAVEYPDGFAIYHVNGVEVDDQIILRPKTQTIEQIHADDNAERRRVRIEKYGWQDYLRETNAAVIDSRKNLVDGTLEVLMSTRVGRNILVCSCPSTAKVFQLEIPEAIRTCEKAQEYLRPLPGNPVGSS